MVALKELRGRSFEGVDGVYGGGTWVVGAFGVVPNPVSGKGPVIYVERAGSVGTPISYGGNDDNRRWVSVESDEAVSQFYELVTGEGPAALQRSETDAR